MSEKSKNILLGVLIVGLVAMTVAYAALSTTLTISGTANVAAATWDIHFENWTKVYPQNGVTGVTNTASDTGYSGTMTPASAGTLIDDLVINLAQPGDQAVYTFDIVNDGSINAKLSTFAKSLTGTKTVDNASVNLTSQELSDITYTIQCGTQANKPAEGAQTMSNAATYTNETTGILLDAHKSIACTLTLTYNEATNTGSGTAGQAQTYTGLARELTLDANWVWVQN